MFPRRQFTLPAPAGAASAGKSANGGGIKGYPWCSIDVGKHTLQQERARGQRKSYRWRSLAAAAGLRWPPMLGKSSDSTGRSVYNVVKFPLSGVYLKWSTRELALIPPRTLLLRIKNSGTRVHAGTRRSRERHEWLTIGACWLCFLFLLQAGRHNHTNKTSKMDWELKYAAGNYSDCSGMAERKIFPQSVRLDEIKTVRNARRGDMSGRFLFACRGLGSSGAACRGFFGRWQNVASPRGLSSPAGGPGAPASPSGPTASPPWWKASWGEQVRRHVHALNMSHISNEHKQSQILT